MEDKNNMHNNEELKNNFYDRLGYIIENNLEKNIPESLINLGMTEEEYRDPESMSEDRMKELSSKMLRFIFDSEPC